MWHEGIKSVTVHSVLGNISAYADENDKFLCTDSMMSCMGIMGNAVEVRKQTEAGDRVVVPGFIVVFLRKQH